MQDQAQPPDRGGFFSGLAAGAIVTALLIAAALYAFDLAGAVTWEGQRQAGIAPLIQWLQRNLGSAAVWFALLLLLFFASLLRLQWQLRRGAAVEEIAQAEHLSEIWASLFFGVGVIYTAIGMRAALIHALGDPSTVAGDGAFAILQRMVEGGILLALSTTIFGGIGGYLMRLTKTLALGVQLKRYYEKQHSQAGARIEALLASIDRRLAQAAPAKIVESRSAHEPIAMV